MSNNAHLAQPQRRLVLAGAAVAALLLAGGGYLLLSGGSDNGDVAAAPATVHAPRARTSATPTPSVSPADPVLGSVRNPYRALYVAGGAQGSRSASPSVAPSSTSPAPSARPPAPTTTIPTTVPTAPTAGSAPPAVAPVATYPLTLVTVTGPDRTGAYAVTWKVAGVSTATLVGQRFGRTGELTTLAVHLAGNGRKDAVLQVGAAKPVLVRVGSTLKVP